MATKLTPKQIDAELAAAEAEHQRLADKAAAIREAGETTRHAVELQCLREAYGSLPKAAREARDQAQRDLNNVANAEQLDIAALAQAFDRLLELDAECGAVQMHVGRLDAVDPLPPNPIGAERARPSQCARLHGGASFLGYVDGLIRDRAEAAATARVSQLRDELAKTIDAAEQVARQQAAQLADGERLHVDTPEAIIEQYHQTIAGHDDDQLDPEVIRGAGLNAARNAVHQRALDTLLAQEAGN